jgi:hypothetical protein
MIRSNYTMESWEPFGMLGIPSFYISHIAQSDVSVGDEGLELAKGYVTYSRLDHTIARTLILIEETKARVNSAEGKPEHVVKLYDTILLVFLFRI